MNTEQVASENTADAAETALQPIVPGAVEFKYAHVPDGFKRLRTKRKVALIFGYIGERYCGLQWNHLPEYPTVEEALMKAMFEVDMISLTNFSQFKVQQLLNFERASRTDRGVHALRNLVSVAAMLPYDPIYVKTYQSKMLEYQALKAKQHPANDEVEDATEKDAKDADALSPASLGIPPAEFSCDEAKRLLNKALPDDIHVYSVTPVTRSFNAYMCCGGRRYEYYIPTFAFMPREEYVNNYFPEALAPSMPSLKDTGFVPRSSRPQLFKGPAQGPVDDAQSANGQNKKKQNQQKNKKWNEQDGEDDGEGPVSYRKSRGHFPKTKKRRLEEQAKKAAEEAAAAAAREQAEADPSSSDKPADATTVSEQRDANNNEETVSASQSDHDEDDDDGEDEDDAAVAGDTVEEELDENGNPKPVDWSQHFATHFSDNIFESMMTFRSIPEEAMRHAASYRLPQAQLEHVRAIFQQYEGTHCFHNFTPGGSSRDASCHRYIPAITVTEPMIWSPSDPLVQASIDAWAPSRFFTPDDRVAEGYSARLMAMEDEEQKKNKNGACDKQGEAGSTPANNAPNQRTMNAADFSPEEVAHLREEMKTHMSRVYGEGLEVVRIELQGQSFMLNQIRKMIGAVVCMCACGLPVSHVQDNLLNKRVRCGIPMAPANGLFLSNLDFSGYNSRLKRIQRDGGNGGNKDSVDLDELIDEAELEEERRRITAVVLRNEMVEDLLGKWMRSLRHVVRLAWKQDLP